MKVPAAMERMITISVVSRADHENSVSEVVPDLDALIHSVWPTYVGRAYQRHIDPAHGVKG
jgi:hypothetical protein